MWEIILLKRKLFRLFKMLKTCNLCFVTRAEKRIFFNVRTLHIWQYSSDSIHQANKKEKESIFGKKQKRKRKLSYYKNIPLIKYEPKYAYSCLDVS